MKNKTLFLVLGAILLVFVGMYAKTLTSPKSVTEGYSQKDTPGVVATTAPTGYNQETQPMEQKKLTQPSLTVDKSKKYTAVMKTTEGTITINLHVSDTPVTVNNFVYLTKQNFYDNTIFHRVIKGFMIQGGDPTGTGAGGPGYRFNDEPFTGEYKRGVVAMANAGPNTNGSQFFIMHADYPLPKNYVIFGDVIGGIDTVDKIAEAPTSQNGMGENSKPVNPVKIESVTINEQ